MKSLLTLTIAAAISTASAAEIPAGTHLLLRMEHSVNSRTANVGDGVHLRTSTPVSVDGRIVVPVGTWVSGTIQHVERRGRLHGQGRLEIGLETLLLPTGLAVSISPLVAVAAKSDFNRNRNRDGHGPLVTGAGLLAGYGSAAIASIWSHDEETAVGVGLSVGLATAVATAILTRNRDLELNAGATLDIVFDHPIKVD